MFKWLFKKQCEHDFKIIGTSKETWPNYDKGIMVTEHKYILFCPKCEKEKKVDKGKYDIESVKEIIRNTYDKGM